eukprot:TRINITY_DN1156_c0_g2_i3.p1 TRINITY_DN1156_c0_g2~~TRINITY_DN1156_c0_g2_i3.p1  ORF type:complete len:287 (-),score=108.17 TRINITY_DN1156_c0_g2_i3:65-925(-)
MFRNQYDTDVTTLSPQGRIHQVEYAMEAVKQGSATVGLRSKTHAVVASLKRSTSELASFQEKIFKIDAHIGISVSGLIADARLLSKFMHNESLNHRYVFSSNMQVGRLVQLVADKSQVYTQKSEKRPYGVGLLVAGYDKTGAHLFETCPSGNFFEYKAQAIGARSQTARTYLEKHFESFEDASLEELIHHALVALRTTVQGGDINQRNVAVGFVGKDTPFTILQDETIKSYTDRVEAEYKEEKKDDSEQAAESEQEEKNGAEEEEGAGAAPQGDAAPADDVEMDQS